MSDTDLANFTQALTRLQEALSETASNPLAVDATIQRFEFTFELAWKSMKHTLLHQEGIEAASPRQALQKAYALAWISDEALWLNMLHDRNLSSHTYRASLAQEIYQRIFDYAPELKALNQFLNGRI